MDEAGQSETPRQLNIRFADILFSINLADYPGSLILKKLRAQWLVALVTQVT